MALRAKTLRPLNQPIVKRLSHTARGYDRAHEKWRMVILARDPVTNRAGLHIYTIKRRARPARVWDAATLTYRNEPVEYADDTREDGPEDDDKSG